jgi:hypothetical protein
LEALQRTLVRGPTFIRLLARLTEIDVPPPQPSLSDRLSDWIDWTRVVALSRVLDGKPPAAGSGPAFDDAEEAAYAATRTSLSNAIAACLELPASTQADVEPAQADYAVFQQHYLAMQRAMLTATGRLRGRLRDLLVGLSADSARLAELDALMEAVLSPREQALLAAVPALLGTHFERLRLAAQPADDAPGAAADAWLNLFRKDMQGVLLAELDVRFLPLEALLAALRSHSLVPDVQTA